MQAELHDFEAETEALVAAIRDLPAASHEAIQRNLAAVVVNWTHSGDLAPVTQFLGSLMMTARLHRNPHYLKALAEADEETLPGEAVDIEAIFARHRAG